jgi:hypothetical protein
MTTKSLLTPKLEAMKELTERKYLRKPCVVKDANRGRAPYCQSGFMKYGCTRGPRHKGLHHHHDTRGKCYFVWEEER